MRPLIVALSAVMIGCAGIATQEGLEQLLRSWEGGDINSLMSSWGPPSRVDELPNGTRMYTYIRTGAYTTPVYVTPTYTSPSRTTVNVYGNTAYATTSPSVTTGGQVLGGQTYVMSCSISFTTDASQRIVTWRYEGNSCKAVAPKEPNSSAQSTNAEVRSEPAAPMSCQTDADCADGQSCRSRKGGGTECRAKTSLPSVVN